VSGEGLTVLGFVFVGVILGLAYFRALAWNVRLYLGRSGGALGPLVHVLRIMGTAAVFVLIARSGGVPLLVTLAGFQVTRIMAVRARHVETEAAV
jgi:F1F0 ATPase subunit 2